MCGKTTLFQKIYYLCHGNKINIMKAIVGNNLKKMRVANNLTQEKFADFLNITVLHTLIMKAVKERHHSKL